MAAKQNPTFYQTTRLVWEKIGNKITVKTEDPTKKAVWEIQIPGSVLESNQDPEIKIIRWANEACRVISVGGMGPSAGWFGV